MRFTILGATGFIGSHLAEQLRSLGHHVFAPSREDGSLLSAHLGNVIYCIGLTADFRIRPFDTVRAHVSVMADVLEGASFDSFLYLSSTRVYSGLTAATESINLTVNSADPSDLYNLSKLMGESLCLNCGRPNTRVARLSNVVGFDPYSANFLTSLIRAAIDGEIHLKTNPASGKDYILLEDVMSVLPQIALSGQERIYNVASGITLSHAELVSKLSELTDCSIQYDAHAPLLEYPPIDVGRIQEEFGYRPMDVRVSLEALVEQYRVRRDYSGDE